MTLVVRRLAAGDAADYAGMRLEGLRSDPKAFASDYASEAARDPSSFAERLETNHVFGAYENERLVGIVGYGVPRQTSMRHRGHVWGMLVRASARGRGIGSELLTRLVEHARSHGVRQLHLGVGTYNSAAIALYQRAGFVTYGTEPRALHIDDQDIDEHLMVLFLDTKE